ncbi:Putative cryptochrome/DNA photolyase class 1, cryptochrome/DNA photolyase, FAD-binding protein [Septoria linicola]|uniref:Cryptochrome/DNA photolyase class 1, cryptochrome/DNA photolyase, FAD-binding protein n=1 Tax=Septoria linicola TaxID=215465 RepID=A0A9Q9AI85_9PEZI|nr:putative cryptochrome/DNA photolyase class 1, cryptochrome/DNA photolyase, FAD-binding protein [Septoria linicola]USW49550.1 Putative cryptochrome/DNA photolyase class 1, cryptochrome/DNA photolyase, FAD-binding protein [Septoria linicola]
MPASKRRATSPVRPTTVSPAKKPRTSDVEDVPIAEKHGVIQRDFYPPEMSDERCAQYNNNEIPRPIEVLHKTLLATKAQREKIKVGDTVVHWFKRDLRQIDNRALEAASKLARKNGANLVCMFIVSPEDYQAHLTSRARVDFDLRTLEVLKKDLAEKNIPLYVHTVENRKDVLGHILERLKEWQARHLFCNVEYEVDELRREAKLIKMALKSGISVECLHDDVVVAPGALKTGGGKQYSVYSPWYRAWVKHIHEHPHLLKASEPPEPNSDDAKVKFKDIFEGTIPSAPPNKALSEADRDRLSSIFPPGEHEAHERLQRFLKEKISAYKDERNIPAGQSTSILSVHFSAGTLSSRTAIIAARNSNSSSKLDAGNEGIKTWISEIAWRDFYKHVLAHWPYICMSKPFKYEYSNIEWEYDETKLQQWKDGMTGFPIVDAAMRQCKAMWYIHNRCRMIVASFLAKDLLLDWRQGEIYFMENLIDGDFASNNGGWGFSASTGVDPQPYFRIFNPLLQSEKFDPQGEYIRKWVPELGAITGKAIHDPYGRGQGKVAEKAGYPKPMVDHSMARTRALERYKTGLGRATANVGGGVHN